MVVPLRMSLEFYETVLRPTGVRAWRRTFTALYPWVYPTFFLWENRALAIFCLQNWIGWIALAAPIHPGHFHLFTVWLPSYWHSLGRGTVIFCIDGYQVNT